MNPTEFDISRLRRLPTRVALALLARAVERVRPLYYLKDWLAAEEKEQNRQAFVKTIDQANAASLGSIIEIVDLPDRAAAAFHAGELAGDACHQLSNAAICMGQYANQTAADQISEHDQIVFIDALTKSMDLLSTALECHVDRASVSKSSQTAFSEAFEIDLNLAQGVVESGFPVLGSAISVDELGAIWHEVGCPFEYLESIEFYAADCEAEEPEYDFPCEGELFEIPNQSLLGYVARIFMRILNQFKPAQISPQLSEEIQVTSQPIIDHCSQFCLGEWGESDNSLEPGAEALEQLRSSISLDETSTAEHEWCDSLTMVAKCLVEIDHQIGAFGHSDELACNGRHFIISETQQTLWFVGTMIESFCEPADQLIAEFAAACRRDLTTLRSMYRSFQPRDFHDYMIGPNVDISNEGPLGPLWSVEGPNVSWPED